MGSATMMFLFELLTIVSVPPALLRISGLKGKVPLVVVQIISGIIFGPSVLGRLAPDIYAKVFSTTSLTAISGIASIAVLLFGLITGLHLGPEVFAEKGRMFTRVALARLLAPTLLGCLAGFWLLSRHPAELLPNVHPGEFALAVGLAIGMTALPVLGMILKEMNMLGTLLGRMALAVAGFNDIALWSLLGLLLAVHSGRATDNFVGALEPLWVPVYLVFMVRVVRPLLLQQVTRRMRHGVVDERALAVVIATTLASGLTTELIGLDYIIGAFVTGAVMPHELRKPILDRLEVLTVMFLMPFFFFATGLKTFIDPGQSAFTEIFVVSTVTSVIAIISSTALAAQWCGASRTFGLALGALLQSKGMMEVIILTVLLNVGLLSTSAFAALVLMGVVCTAIAMPLARTFLAQAPEEGAAEVSASSFPGTCDVGSQPAGGAE